MISKVKSHHKEKPAYIYIRQSTVAQVRHHQESTERQYALKEKALQMGWSEAMICILDGDLGVSGAQSDGRDDFKTLVADVSMRKVGAVFALEASRLSRSYSDWQRLLELCSLTDTLIVDEDGCYDPADFNDQLLLGLKGTMSQAELHFLHARLYGGKLNKANKGLLRFPLPVGLCYDEEGQIVLDPDEEVRGAVCLLFSLFHETGTAYAVVQRFANQKFKFPKRSYGGVWNGKIIWGRLTHSRVLTVLKNPSYAGAYVFGRYQYAKAISPESRIQTKMTVVPMTSWRVNIQDHHPGYITWEEYLHNQTILEHNLPNKEATILSGAAREGLALLQGLLLCAKCGRKLYVRYKGNGGIYPTYQCNWQKREGLSGNACMSLRCDLLDNAVSARMLEVIQPAQIKLALDALQEMERRNKAIDHQWAMKLERSQYEAQLAERRYAEVDPANRLVAATLETRWNEALAKMTDLREQYTQYQQKEAVTASSQQKAQLLSLAKDLPRLWAASTTQPKDRKRILRLFIKDITVEKLSDSKQAILHIRWQGGASEDITVNMPLNISDKLRYPEAIVEQVRNLAAGGR